MSKLLKSKFLLGALVVAVMFGAVGLLGAKSVSADCSITHTLRMGSTGAEVVCLQTALGGLTADGSFGPKTKAAVISWQAKSGLVADGVFGPKSNAVWMANQGNAMNFPAGCTSAAGFSTTTGMSCAGSGMTLPAGCSSTAGFSTTTGMSCSASSSLPAGCTSTSGFSPTTGMSCSGGTTSGVSGTNGYLSDFGSDSTNRVTTVYESETDKVVAGFRATARLSSQAVNRVRVTFVNINTSSSANLGKYITSASLWYGSTKLQTIAVADASRGTSDDIYTFNFSGINANIPMTTVGRFYVSVNAVSSMDSTDATNATWTVTFLSGGVSASSPDGSYDTYPSSDIVQTGLKFGKFVSNGVKATVGLASDNPAATTLAVNNTSATNGVTLVNFTVKATNSNLTLRKIPVQVRIVSGTAADDVTNVINTIKLMRGSNVVDSLSGTSGFEATYGSASNTTTACTNTASAADDVCTFYFSNLSNPDNMINSGDTAEFSIVVDLAAQSNYAAGTTVEAEINNADVLLAANFSVQDQNGDQLTNANSSIRVGSAVGQVMTLLVNGVNVTQSAATINTTTDSGVITSVTYNIPLTVTAFGQTLYTGQAAVLGAATSGTGATAKAFSFALQEAAAPATDITSAPTGVTVSSTLASDASIENLGFRLDSGSTKHYTLQVILTCSAGACSTATTANYRVHVTAVATDTVNSLPTNTNQTLVPSNNYQTAFQKIK